MAELLVTGASGLLGANMVLESASEHQVTAVYHSHPVNFNETRTISADLSNRESALSVIQEEMPEWVVHCAGETNLDRCEVDVDRAFLLNRDMARWVAEAAWSIKARLIHISTDAVFDGKRRGCSEEDEANPISIYGQSKLDGEVAVLSEHPEAMVVRTNFYGWNAIDKFSLAEWFLSKLECGEECEGFSDVFVRILLVNDLVSILLQMLEKRLSGIFHVLGGECISKYDFGVRVAEVFGFNPSTIRPISVDQLGLDAPRSKDLCLSTEKIRDRLNLTLPSIDEGLQRFSALRESGYSERLKEYAGGLRHEEN